MDVDALWWWRGWEVADGGFAFAGGVTVGGGGLARWRWEFEGFGEGGGVWEDFAGVDEAETVGGGFWREVCADLTFEGEGRRGCGRGDGE